MDIDKYLHQSLSYEASNAQLFKTREELDMLSNSILGGVARMAVDDRMRILNASEGYYRMTGYTAEESLDSPFWGRGVNLVIPADLPAVNAAIEKLLKENRPVSVNYRFRRKDGSVGWNTAYCARVENGPEGRFVDVFFMDTSESKTMEIQLESLLDSIPSGVVRAHVGAEIRILYANEEFYRQIGYMQEEFEREFAGSYMRLVHPEDIQAVIENNRRILASNERCPSFEYRIINKEGATRWMRLNASCLGDKLEQDGIIQCIVTDVTDERQRRRQNELNEERYRIISEQTRDTVYDWDIASDYVHCSPIFEKMFGFSPPESVPVKRLLEYNFIYEEDKAVIADLISKVHAGIPYMECDVRLRRGDGVYFWVWHRATTIFDEANKPIRVIGIITDIDDDRKEKFDLQEKVMRDSMTGLYNRMAAEMHIEQTLRKSKAGKFHAFLEFDIDHFKEINDFMGHSAGDAALKQIAACLLELFRETDMVARMGGDEFAVFLQNVPSIQAACDKADRLRTALCRDFCFEDSVYPLSISIGLAFYPKDGEDFQTLYENADLSLYKAKRGGGNCFQMFSKE